MESLIVNLFESYPIAGTILAGLLAAHSLALFIVNLVPDPRVKGAVKTAYTVVKWVAGIVGKDVVDREKDN